MNLQNSQYESPVVFAKPKVNIDNLVNISLPPSPDNVMRLTRLLRDYDTPPRKISEIIAREPLLVARILRMANSPIYGATRKVTSVETAVSSIGNKILLDMVMMALASSTFDRAIRNSPVARKIWEHSLTVGLVARQLSEELGMRGTEEAFTCGLLHDIGKMILLSYDFRSYAGVLNEDDEEQMLDIEYDLFGYTHAQVGALVARRWQLQDEVCYAIGFHHNPSQSPYPMMIAHVVEIADLIANAKGYGLRSEDEFNIILSPSAVRLRLTIESLENVWSKVEENLDTIIKTFAN